MAAFFVAGPQLVSTQVALRMSKVGLEMSTKLGLGVGHTCKYLFSLEWKFPQVGIWLSSYI